MSPLFYPQKMSTLSPPILYIYILLLLLFYRIQFSLKNDIIDISQEIKDLRDIN